MGSEMCIRDRMRDEVAEKATHNNAVNTALRMLAKDYKAEEIAEITGLSLEEVRKLANNQKA